MRCKIIRKNNFENLEDAVNKFLSEYRHYTIKYIKYIDNKDEASVLILYE